MKKLIISISKSDEVKRNISIVLFWGAIWGIAEATLGYFLHLISFSMGWCIWLPLAFYFLNKVYTETKKTNYLVYVGVIAAAIKLVDLFMASRIDKVINPAAAIVFEALALCAVYKVLENKGRKLNYLAILAMNFSWRIMYSLYLFVMPTSFFIVSPLRGLEPFLKFLFLESIVTSIIIYVYLKLMEKLADSKKQLKEPKIILKPIISLSMLVLAIIIQFII